MEDFALYNDIGKRTDGSIYIGVVGPVRTGKSTFIKRFMESLVIPNIPNDYKKERALDELPQSASGRTIMTTEPKFIPDEAIEIKMGQGAALKVRMIDCVGYIVESSLGYIEQNAPRMVTTPWSDEPMPFNKAAEMGTRKVICEHSTIGILVTTDGSICDIPRNDYENAEERVVKELKDIRKPFVIVLNSANPNNMPAQKLRAELEAKYCVPVIAVNCLSMGQGEIFEILESVLFEFPVRELSIRLPGWIDPLNFGHWLKKDIYNSIRDCAKRIKRVRDIEETVSSMQGLQYIDDAKIQNINLGDGSATVEITLDASLYFKVLSEVAGVEINDDKHLVSTLKEMSKCSAEYKKVKNALDEVRVKGYGIVTPSIEELKLEEPEIVKQGGRYGIRLRASAPSIHMIRADIETEVSPIVGNEKQSEELINYLMKDFEVDPSSIWQSNFFGKTLHELVNEGLSNKLSRMPEDARFKLQETLQKIINEGSGGLICIIL